MKVGAAWVFESNKRVKAPQAARDVVSYEASFLRMILTYLSQKIRA